MTAVMLIMVTSTAMAQQPRPEIPDFWGMDLKMRQEAWLDPEGNMGPGQQKPGYRMYEYHWSRTYEVRTRVAMSTTIRLDPEEDVVKGAIALGDPSSFEVKRIRKNAIEVRPLVSGTDTSLKLYTEKGRVYSFYLVSENTESEQITDLMIDVLIGDRNRGLAPGNAIHPGVDHRIKEKGTTSFISEAIEDKKTVERSGSGWNEADDRLFGNLRTIGFDPANARFDLKAYGSSDEAIERIAPERIFRDLQWTYLLYPTKARSMNDWPVAMLLSQGTEIPVPTRVEGDNRDVLIVEAVGDIVLRSGDYVICIRIDEEGRGPVQQPAVRTVVQPTELLAPAKQETKREMVNVRIDGMEREDVNKLLETREILNRTELADTQGKISTRVRVMGFEQGMQICRMAQESGNACTVER